MTETLTAFKDQHPKLWEQMGFFYRMREHHGGDFWSGVFIGQVSAVAVVADLSPEAVIVDIEAEFALP